jgi:hypothetical protein
MNESLKTIERPKQVDVVSDLRVVESSKISSNSSNNKRMLILFSSSSGRLNQKTAQTRALTILKGMRIDDQSQYLEQIDGADQNHLERRKKLFAISGCREYPQFFLVDSNDKTKFLCKWETFELMHDTGILSGFMNLGNTTYTATNTNTNTNTMTTTTTTTTIVSPDIQKQDAVFNGRRMYHRTRTFLKSSSCPHIEKQDSMIVDTTIRPLCRQIDERINEIELGKSIEASEQVPNLHLSCEASVPITPLSSQDVVGLKLSSLVEAEMQAAQQDESSASTLAVLGDFIRRRASIKKKRKTP